MKFSQVESFRGDANTIRIVGHRGARGILPENSIIGFDFALSIGVDLLEFGAPKLHARLDRTGWV